MLIRGILLALSLSACGYTVVGTRAPFGLAKLAVVPFDEAVPAGISADIADELTRLLASGGAAVIWSESEADGVLSGEITSATTSPSPVRSATSRIASYSLAVTVRVELKNREGKKLWGTQLNDYEDFLPAPDAAAGGAPPEVQTLATEANRREAMRRLALRLARSINEQFILLGSKNAGTN